MTVTKSFAKRARVFKQRILVLYFGLKDARTPFYARVPAVFSLLYLLSPIDIIPDFIPVAGYIDDLIIVPLLLNLSIRLLPRQVREDCQLKAIKETRKFRIVFVILLIIILLLLVGAFFLGKKLLEEITNWGW